MFNFFVIKVHWKSFFGVEVSVSGVVLIIWSRTVFVLILVAYCGKVLGYILFPVVVGATIDCYSVCLLQVLGSYVDVVMMCIWSCSLWLRVSPGLLASVLYSCLVSFGNVSDTLL